MTKIALALAFVSLLATIGFALSAYAAAYAFFRRLVQSYPELAGAFPKPTPFTRYGPIRPSYMSYLKVRKYLFLPELDLQAQGAKTLRLLYIHAACFLIFVLSSLWWGYQNGA